MPKYDIIVTVQSEFNGVVEANTRDEAVEIAIDVVTQRRNLNVKVERVILVTPDEPILPLRRLPTSTEVA